MEKRQNYNKYLGSAQINTHRVRNFGQISESHKQLSSEIVSIKKTAVTHDIGFREKTIYSYKNCIPKRVFQVHKSQEEQKD